MNRNDHRFLVVQPHSDSQLEFDIGKSDLTLEVTYNIIQVEAQGTSDRIRGKFIQDTISLDTDSLEQCDVVPIHRIVR